jgi:hypothetical protein
MDEGKRAWIKGDEEKCKMPETGGLQKQAGVNPSTNCRECPPLRPLRGHLSPTSVGER